MNSIMMWTAALAMALIATAAVADGVAETTLTTVGIDAAETSFGHLATDAISDAAGTIISLAPAVMFKAGEMPPGPVTVAGVSGLLNDPDETWAVLRLTGAQIRAALERSVSSAPTPRAFFLQVSGLTFVYDPEAPRGRKVKSITLGFAEFSETQTFEVGMPEGLADGGTGYFTIFGDAPRVRSGTRGVAQIIRDYVSAKGTVSYTGQGRVLVGK